jgi:hypothetical protein
MTAGEGATCLQCKECYFQFPSISQICQRKHAQYSTSCLYIVSAKNTFHNIQQCKYETLKNCFIIFWKHIWEVKASVLAIYLCDNYRVKMVPETWQATAWRNVYFSWYLHASFLGTTFFVFVTGGITIGVLSENRTLPLRPGKHMIARNQWQLENKKKCIKLYISFHEPLKVV